MSYGERMRIRHHLMEHIAEWILSHGTVKADRHWSNDYTYSRDIEAVWRGAKYHIVQVDGMTCIIERV